jgi:hypothetical protein
MPGFAVSQGSHDRRYALKSIHFSFFLVFNCIQYIFAAENVTYSRIGFKFLVTFVTRKNGIQVK